MAVTAERANPLFGVEQRGFDHIPEPERTMTLRETAFFWVGTNANLFFVSVGVIALEVGLEVWEALVAVVLGTSLFAVVGIASIGGVRSGLPTMTFTRAAFGSRGNIPNGVLTWAALVAFEAINCIFGVYALLALMSELGWHDPGAAGKVLATLVVLGASAAIAIYGHATMVYVQRFLAVALTLVLALVLAYSVGGVDWTATAHQSLSGRETVAAILAAGAVVASGPISYLFNAPDFVRYLPARTSGRSIVWTVALSSGLIALLLSVMGVLLASRGDMSDPIAGVDPFVPGWLYVLYILAAAGGSIANNVVAYYSSGLCLQSVGLPLKRFQATALDTLLSTAMVLYILFVRDFTTVLHDFVALLVAWLGPFAAVWITDGLMRRWRYDPAEVHDMTPRSEYWGWRGFGLPGWVALLAGVVVCVLTMNAPIFQGPVSHALAGADFSWTLGPIVSAAVYWAIARDRQSRRSSRARDTATARVSASSLR
jgi:nucleobase:cation symporter-1, NCS1 family